MNQIVSASPSETGDTQVLKQAARVLAWLAGIRDGQVYKVALRAEAFEERLRDIVARSRDARKARRELAGLEKMLAADTNLLPEFRMVSGIHGGGGDMDESDFSG